MERRNLYERRQGGEKEVVRNGRTREVSSRKEGSIELNILLLPAMVTELRRQRGWTPPTSCCA